MSLRLPSQNKAFKPVKPGARKPTAPSGSSQPAAPAGSTAQASKPGLSAPRPPWMVGRPPQVTKAGPGQVPSPSRPASTTARPSAQVAQSPIRARPSTQVAPAPTPTPPLPANPSQTQPTQSLPPTQETLIATPNTQPPVGQAANASTHSSQKLGSMQPPATHDRAPPKAVPKTTPEVAQAPLPQSSPVRAPPSVQSKPMEQAPITVDVPNPVEVPVVPSAFRPPSPKARERQHSQAPSAITSISGVSRAGRPKLLQIAEARAANGTSAPSPGRIPPRRDRAAIAAAVMGGAPEPPGPAPRMAPRPSTNQISRPAKTPTPSQRPVSVPPAAVSSPAAGPSRASQTPTGFPPTVSTEPPKAPSVPSGFPPSLALEDPSSTLDPALSEAAQKEQAARERAEAMAAAAAVVATIAPAAGAEKAKARRVGKKDPERKGIKTSKRPYRDPFTKDKNKYRYADKSAEGSGTNSEEPPDEAAQKAEEKKRPRRRAPTKKRTSAEIDAENEENALNEPNGEEGAPPKKRARAKNGEGGSKRTAKAEKNDKESSVTVERFVLGDVNPGEMFGEEPEPEALTMAALATKAIGGKVSERGIILDKFNQTMEEQRRAESARRRKERWQNGQLYRRKLRAENNENRAARREDARAQGLDPLDIVSEDSEDSEEEFEIAPDRMTPPAEDEREPRREPLRIGPPTQSAPREVGRFAVSGTAGAGDDDEEVDENDPDAMLRAAGFTVEAGAEGGEMEDGEQADGENGGENEDEDEDAEEPDWGAMDMDAYAYHQDIEDRRRQIIEGTDSREVIEEDDETKMINSGTYGKIAKIERWTAKETEMFYVVLQETGQNPQLMAGYFIGRTQKQLKRKMNKEFRENPTRFNYCLDNPRPIDLDYLRKSVGLDMARAWDKEDELLEEMAKDKEDLRRQDLGLDPLDAEDNAVVEQNAVEEEDVVMEDPAEEEEDAAEEEKAEEAAEEVVEEEDPEEEDDDDEDPLRDMINANRKTGAKDGLAPGNALGMEVDPARSGQSGDAPLFFPAPEEEG